MMYLIPTRYQQLLRVAEAYDIGKFPIVDILCVLEAVQNNRDSLTELRRRHESTSNQTAEVHNASRHRLIESLRSRRFSERGRIKLEPKTSRRIQTAPPLGGTL